MAAITMGVTALDCPDPHALAAFYAAVLDWKIDPESDDEWVELIGPQGRTLAFQRSEGYRAPQWPGVQHSQQMHLDFDVFEEQMDEAEAQVLALGATLLEGDHDGARAWRVYADPVGHPFCLCANG
ncbi:VOC family protein [Streptomyces sp. XM4193]|uniref:VOC family protein n=1 Tax=Streptomyces sp. XM4193 TaxID=2929782 RepID=UPI001FFA5A28|nr:VOC family protein [Streptomyces sp. XM4193]MCK1796965.1 VOC family protein [Streptomyces sp. XM4193]